MQNKRPSKLLTLQKTSNSHGDSSGKVVRKIKREASELAIEDIQRNEISDNGVEGKTPASDLLRVCRPLSVYLTRLPDSLVNKNIDAGKKPQVKRRRALNRWRHGTLARKYPRNKKQQKEANKLRQSLQLQVAENENNLGESVTSHGSSTNFNTTETLTAGPLSSDVEKSTVKENENVEITARLRETARSLAHEITLLKAQEYNTLNTVRFNVAPPSSDTFSNSEGAELAEEQELQIDGISAGTENSPLATKEQPDDRTSLVEGNCTENSTVSQPPEGRRSRSSSRQARKRRNSSLSESSRQQEALQHQKKARPFLSISESSVSSSEERNATVTNEIAITSPQRPVLLTNSKKSRRTSPKQQRKAKKIQSMNEVVVVVNRLDNSRSPLVEKWKNKVDLSRLDEVTPNLRESLSVSTSLINQVEKENESEFELTITGNGTEGMTVYSPALMDLSSFDNYENNDIVMCDSNEDDSEADDDEIIEFLAARRRTKSPIARTHFKDKTVDELDENQQLSRSSSKTSPVRRSDSRSSVKQRRGRSRQRKQSFHTIDDATSETSSYSITYRRIQSKSPALEKPSKARRLNYTYYDDSSYEEGRSTRYKSPPLTRSKSRAALEHSYSDESMNSSEIFYQKRSRKICYRLPSDTSESLHEAHETNEEINEIESQPVVDNAENVQDVAEIEQIGEDMDSLDSAAAHDSNLTLIDTLQFDRDNDIENCIARKKLATMKDAMVVLTRLEDLTNQYSDSETEFETTGDYNFSSNFSSREDYNDETDDVDATSCRSVDPLQIDNNPVVESPVSEELLVNNVVESPLESENLRENGLCPRNEQTNQDQRLVRVSEEWVQLESDTTLTRNDVAFRDMSESNDERQLTVDESVPTESTESDVELTLIVDECDNTRTETPRILSEGGILMDANRNNDRVKRTPPVLTTPSKDLVGESGKRCNCKEHQGDERHEKCQNISPSHKCITCDRLFKDSALLEQHKTSSTFCNSGFRCNFCQVNFKTLIELSKHRSGCAEKKLQRRHSLDPKTHEETLSEAQTSAVTNFEASRSKGKKQKQVSQKNVPKKNRNRARCRSDNLTCNVCSMNFDTKTDLSEHLYKHSPEELQEAFRAAKAKAMADSQAEQAAKRKEVHSSESSDKSVDNQASTIISSANDNNPIQNPRANETQIIVSDVSMIASTTLNNDSLVSKQANVCLCHRDTDLTSLDKTDLQIEMVLLCKYCHVIFRRRECLEVHYRTSSICSVNRTRERCPSLFCANCQLTLNSWADMRQHLEIHAHQNSERTIRFACNICRVVFVGFGVLFYNHWTSHSKDPMFVAGRYNFPRFSVQTITGTEKLPAGAKSDENYIFVAEHVCATCKKPFSTRRDLEIHQQSVSCTKPTPPPATTKSKINTLQRGGRPNKVNPRFRNEAHVPKTKQTPKKSQNNVNTKQNEHSPTLITSKTTTVGNKDDLVKKSMYCDVCRLAFINEHWLNMHSTNMHKNHFTFVPTTLSGTPLLLPFKCNKCSAFTGSVSAIEEHWLTDALHDHTAALLKNMKISPSSKSTKRAAVTSSLEPSTDSQNPFLLASLNNTTNVTSTDKSKTSKEPLIITIDDADSNSNSRASTPIIQNVLTHNEESVLSMPSITSTESIPVSNSNQVPVLRDPLENTPPVESNTNEKQRVKIRALEDPCVNVMLSKTSDTNVSASLVIDDTEERTNENTVNSNTELYRILLPNESSTENLKMILSRTSSTDSVEETRPISLTESSIAENNKVAETESSDPTILVDLDVEPRPIPPTGLSVAENNKVAEMKSSEPTVPANSDEEPTLVLFTPSSVAEKDNLAQTQGPEPALPVDSDEEPTLVILTPCTVANENEASQTLTQLSDSTAHLETDSITTQPKTTPDQMAKKATNISVVPEVIDILDDPEDCENGQSTGHENTTVFMKPQSCTESLIDNNKMLNSLLESGSSDTDKLHTDASAVTINAPKCLPVHNTPKPFEQSSGSDSSSNPTAGKSSSPGRSKMNKAALKLCNVSFEEARWNWLCSLSGNRDIANSTAPKKQGFLRVKDLSELQAVRNHVCCICNSSFESEKSLDEHRQLPMCGGSVQGRNTQYPRGISAALVLPDPSERPKTPETDLSPLDQILNNTKSSVRGGLESPPPLYPLREIPGAAPGQRIQTINQLPTIALNNNSLGSWTSIVGNTPVSSINSNQVQDSQLLQQHQLMLSGGSMLLQDSNHQGLPENRTSSLGYHALPPMVSLPTAPINKHQSTIAPLRNLLPKCMGRNAPMIIHQPDKQNKFLCTICHTFECMSLEAINEHVRKHFHGWKNSTVTQDSGQPSLVARVPVPSSDILSLSSSEIIRGERTQQVPSKNTRPEMVTATNRLTFHNWTVKDTPQGPVLVTPHSNESNNNRSVLRQASFNSNNLASNAPYSGQLVLRCRICKSAVYKSYAPLRNHAILVHGITDFNLLVQENISQNSYLCTQCPNSSTLFDTGEEFREHVDTIHTHSCPSCQRVFSNFLTLRHHLEQCRVSTSSNRNTYGNNC